MSTFKEKKSGFKFTIDASTGPANSIINEGLKFHALIEWCGQYLSDTTDFIDIGAHMGSYALILSSTCRTVHAFEPGSAARAWLHTAIEDNTIPNVKVYDNALSFHDELVDLYHFSPDGLQSSLCKAMGVTSVEEVETRTLDSFHFTNVGFIKISVNGSELDVLKGAKSTLETNQYPQVFVHSTPAKRDAVHAWFKELGYKVHPVTGGDDFYLASDHPSRPKKVVAKEDSIVQKYERGEAPADFNDCLALAKHYRDARMYMRAYKCAQLGLTLTQYPRHKIQLQYELSIAAFYIGKLNECLEHGSLVMLSFLTSWEVRNHMLRVISRCLRPLKAKRYISLDAPVENGYCSSSTSLVPHWDGFRACIRTVNYVINDEGGYIIHDADSRVRTTNYLMNLDFNLSGGSTARLVDNSGVKLYPLNILGMEDVRLFGDHQLFAVYPEVNDQRIPQMCYGEYDDTGSVTKLIPLNAASQLQCEKNWLPFILNGEVHFIYNISPFQLYRLNTTTGEVTLVKRESLCDENINDFRGSAPPIPHRGGWLAVIHQVYHSSPRNYFHRLVWFNRDFTQMKYSELFYFQHLDIEYTLSICHSDQGLIIPYSYRDSSCVLAIIDYAEINRMIE